MRDLLSSNRVRKLLGISALLGVAATGVVLARRTRDRHDYTPSEVREHLHLRHAEAVARQRRETGD